VLAVSDVAVFLSGALDCKQVVSWDDTEPKARVPSTVETLLREDCTPFIAPGRISELQRGTWSMCFLCPPPLSPALSPALSPVL
jgi:hypothetical protein